MIHYDMVVLYETEEYMKQFVKSEMNHSDIFKEVTLDGADKVLTFTPVNSLYSKRVYKFIHIDDAMNSVSNMTWSRWFYVGDATHLRTHLVNHFNCLCRL